MSVIDKLKQRTMFDKSAIDAMQAMPIDDDSFLNGYIFAIKHEFTFIEEIIAEMDNENG